MSIKEFIANSLASLDTHNKGFSARKLAAFTIITMIIIAHVKWFKSDKWEYLAEVLALDFGFIALCLGMTTYEAIKKNSPPTTGSDTTP